MIRRTTLGLLWFASCLPALAEDVRFTSRPSASKSGDGVAVAFAVDRETDVAVYVLDAKGEVVRHWVAGVLGKNAPAPLKADSLEQALTWDGLDDRGEKAAGGPFTVRVAAGLTPKHAGFPLERPGEPYVMNGVVYGIGVGPDGAAYTITHRQVIRASGGHSIQRYTRNGDYAGTQMPFSSEIDRKYARGITPLVDETGRPMMVYNSSRFAIFDYMPATPIVQTPAVRKNGNLLMVNVDWFTWERGAAIGLTELRPDGGTPETPYVWLLLKGPARFWKGGSPALVLSEDEKSVYVAGLLQYIKHRNIPPYHAVFRTALDGDGTLEPIFGEPLAPGEDETHLNNPVALASDGKGHLLVADRGNKRVVVLNEKDGSWVGSFAVENPLWVGVHRKTGAVYVYSHVDADREKKLKTKDELIKFSAWPGSKAGHRVTLSSKYYKGGRYVMGMDAHAQTPRIWMGQFYNSEAMKRPTPQLLGFCDDLGKEFSEFRPVPGRPGGSLWWSVTSDPTHRYVTVNRGGTRVIDDVTGEILRPAKARGTAMMGPDGLIYTMSSGGNLRRYTMKGEAVPFKAIKPGAWIVAHDEKGRPGIVGELAGKRLMGGTSYKQCRWSVSGQALPTYPSGTSGNERDFTIDLAGNIYVKNRGAEYHGPMKVDVYDRDGAYLRTAIWELGDGDYGPRLDAKGNLYFALGVVEKGGSLPDVLKSVKRYAIHYASIVKFSPAGGTFMYDGPEAYAKNFGFTPPVLDMKKETVTMLKGRNLLPNKVLEGALWWRSGFSVYADLRRSGTDLCHCNGQSFDVDLFGRTFYPDMLRFQIVVLDTNGNEIHRFGAYGSRDQRGPFSWIRDAQTGRLRPRGEGDPDGLSSPFSDPEFAFAFLNGVAVGRTHLYATDTLNQRVTRIRMAYQAEASCKIQ